VVAVDADLMQIQSWEGAALSRAEIAAGHET
jgi:hypothetical protein